MRFHKQFLWYIIIFISTLSFISENGQKGVSVIQKAVLKWFTRFNIKPVTIQKPVNVWEEYLERRLPPLECSDFFEENEKVFARYRSVGRLQIRKEPKLSMDCTDVRQRVMGNNSYHSGDTYAVARNVYKDYYLQEILLSISYSSENRYCYALDSKADQDFITKMQQMAYCLPNVEVLDKYFPFDSAGHYQNHAHYACMQKLLNSYAWKYVLLLQNSDVIIKTPEEVSSIMSVLDGSPVLGFVEPIKKRIPNVELTAKEMKLFKSESLKSDKQLNTPMTIRKSSTQMFLPREFVESVAGLLNVTTMMDTFNDKKKYGVDEMFFPTLIGAHFLGLPGQVENKCKVGDAIRYVHWNFASEKSCKSFKKRHFVCLLGVEYLKTLAKTTHIIANKIWPDFDIGTLICIREMLKNRAMEESYKIKLTKFYRNLAQVREREMRKRGFDVDLFRC